MIDPKNIKRILVINLGGIGDMLISTPALRALKEHFPGSELYILAAGRVAGVARDLAYVDKVFVFEPDRPLLKLFSNLKNALELRGLKVDLGINMRTLVSDSGASKIRFIMDLIKPGIKAGRDTARRGHFLDISIPEDDIGEKYEMDYDIETVRALGAAVNDKKIDFTIDPGSVKRAWAMLKDGGIEGSDMLIGIHPGGKPSHRWPADSFAEVLKRLHERFGCGFVITGSKDEAGLACGIALRSRVKALNLAGKLTARELGAVLKKCDLYITNDTGSMHIAAIVDAPLVAIFGPGYLKRYDPRNISSKAVVLYHEENCSPCNKSSCASVKCLRAISVEEVIEAAAKLLGRDGIRTSK